MKKLEILIVEDNPKHLEDVKTYINEKLEAGAEIKVDYASNLKEAEDCTAEKKYDGIICDIFFPAGNENEKEVKDDAYEVLKAMYPDSIGKKRYLGDLATDDDFGPLGVIMAEKVKDDVPFVFCTSTYHHGDKTHFVVDYAEKQKIPLIEISQKVIRLISSGDLDKNVEHTEKQWDEAYYELIKKVVCDKFGVKDRYDLNEEQEAEFKQLREKYYPPKKK
ncbi:hypothetical protein KY332_01735 [Candidatus Woesearchaeota archaeon]|nr:hypothetical protein [Candidatus Woesearchaeota archaeon]